MLSATDRRQHGCADAARLIAAGLFIQRGGARWLSRSSRQWGESNGDTSLAPTVTSTDYVVRRTDSTTTYEWLTDWLLMRKTDKWCTPINICCVEQSLIELCSLFSARNQKTSKDSRPVVDRSQVDSTFYPPWDGKMSTSKMAMMLCSAVGKVTTGLAESNGSLPLGGWLKSPAVWLPVHRDQHRAQSAR